MINYRNLSESLDFYEKNGFKRIESPWLVSHQTVGITKPAGAEDYVVRYSGKSKSFVASGEQSFLYLINKGFLPNGKYQTITPCMRHEDFDDTHTKYFMKNELIIFDDVSKDSLDFIVETALEFFKSISEERKHGRFEVVEISELQFDINFNGVELGSYGIRECAFVKWVYGTGLAEPRFSRVVGREG